MKKIVSILIISLAGCALPRYESKLVPLGNPSVSDRQATAICIPEANMAKQNARARVQAQINNQNSQVTGYNCSTQTSPYYGTYQSNSKCVARTYGQNRGPYASLEDYSAVNNAGNNAFANTLQSCFARLGWQVKEYCVENCN